MSHLKRGFIALAMMIGGSAYLGAGLFSDDDSRVIWGGGFLLFGLILLAGRFERTYQEGMRDGQGAAAPAVRTVTTANLEATPVRNKEASPMTDNNPEEVVKKAIKVLEEKEVGTNIAHLLNDYLVTGDKVQVQTSALVPERISTEYKLEKCDKSLLLTYDAKIIQIIVANLHRSYAPDSSDDYGDLILLSQGECVLKSSTSKHYGEWGSDFSVSFYPFNLDKVKLGTWIDDLAAMVKVLKEAKTESERQRKDAELKKTASNIDLGDYK